MHNLEDIRKSLCRLIWAGTFSFVTAAITGYVLLFTQPAVFWPWPILITSWLVYRQINQVYRPLYAAWRNMKLSTPMHSDRNLQRGYY